MDATLNSGDVPLLDMIRGTLDTKAESGETVALKALHSGALALSRQRRALKKKAAVSPAVRIARRATPIITTEEHGMLQNTEVRPKEAQLDSCVEALEERLAAAAGAELVSASPLQPLPSWPALAEPRGDAQIDFKASIEAEAAALGRAHRSMYRIAHSKSAPSSPPVKEVTFAAIVEDSEPAKANNINVCSVCGQSCPVCGGPDPLKPSSGRVNEEQVLAARLEMAETLLARAGPEAARAINLEHELDAERARSADLAEALRGTQMLAYALQDGLEETTRQLELFMAQVRLTVEAADDSLKEGKAEVRNIAQAFQEVPQALVTSLQKDDGRLEQLHAAVCKLNAELHTEKETAHHERRAASRASTAEFSLQERLTIEEMAAREELQEQLHEESTRARRATRHSTLLDMSVRNTEAEVNSIYAQLRETQAELQHNRLEEREMANRATQRHHELHAVRSDLQNTNEELLTASGLVQSLRLGIRRHNIHSGALQADIAREVQAALEVIHKENVLQMVSEPKPPPRSIFPWRKRPRVVDPAWQAVFVQVQTDTLKPAARRGKSNAQPQALDTEQVPVLQWKKDARLRPECSLSLKDVLSVDFGQALELDVLPPTKPWNCFALRSTSSGDPSKPSSAASNVPNASGAAAVHYFWSDDDAKVEAFIVGLSRVCPRVPPVRGREFRTWRTMAKIGRTRIARARALMQAVRCAAPEPNPVIVVSDPDGAQHVLSPQPSPLSFGGSARAASSSSGYHQDAGEQVASPMSFAGDHPASSSSGQRQVVFQPVARDVRTPGTPNFSFANTGAASPGEALDDLDGVDFEGSQDLAHDAAHYGEADRHDSDAPALLPEDELDDEEGEEEGADQWFEESQSSTREGSTRSASSFPPEHEDHVGATE